MDWKTYTKPRVNLSHADIVLLDGKEALRMIETKRTVRYLMHSFTLANVCC